MRQSIGRPWLLKVGVFIVSLIPLAVTSTTTMIKHLGGT
jgi:DMSO/TMAO reductase YedYZ heme-binding membrane subunit